MNACPPSSPGNGKILIIPRLTLNMAMKLIKAIIPMLVTSPAIEAIWIGPPKFFIFNCPVKKELCKLCDKEFDDFNTLEKHMQSYHDHKSSSDLLWT